MPPARKETQILLAIEALQNDENLSIREAARIHGVSNETLRRRRAGLPARCQVTANSRKLTDAEERRIVEFMTDLRERSFPPLFRDLEDMANHILRARHEPVVGKLWARNFVARHPELGSDFHSRYEYKHPECEDPAVIRDWYKLVQSVVAKHRIQDDDIFNFDEMGYTLGGSLPGLSFKTSDGRSRANLGPTIDDYWATVIMAASAAGWTVPPFIILAEKNRSSGWDVPSDWIVAITDNGWTTNDRGLEWIKHFDKHTADRRKGSHRLLILDGHETHHSTEFEIYCQEQNIVTVSMPTRSAHLLQPLDDGCFTPLRQAFAREVNIVMREDDNYLGKDEFLTAFCAGYLNSVTEENIKKGFNDTGLVPFDPEKGLAALDALSQEGSPRRYPFGIVNRWTSLIRSQIRRRNRSNFRVEPPFTPRTVTPRNYSLSSILDDVHMVSDGMRAVMRENAALRVEYLALREANDALNRQIRADDVRVKEES